MDRWSGKVALVTGASAGIGKAIAYALAEQGMRVIAIARREEKLKELQKSAAGLKGTINIKVCDVTVEQEIINVVKAIENEFGALHVLVNNAGTAYNTKVLDCNVPLWRTMFELNVIALGVCTREAVASMRKKGIDDGYIINISSISGHGVPSGQHLSFGKHVYCGSKHAVRLVTEGIRAELNALNSGIKISTISPGVVETEIFDVGGWDISKDTPTLKSEDIAAAVVSILSTHPKALVADLVIRPLGEQALIPNNKIRS